MKHLFMIEPGLKYLNHGSFGACPKSVLAKYQEWQRKIELNPVEFFNRKSGALLLEARQDLAAYLKSKAENLVFVTNSTSGVNIVARSLPLKPGDEVITTDHEYGACENIWKRICEAKGVKYKKVTIPLSFKSEDFEKLILNEVTDHTRAIYLSHITSTTALIFPITNLCKKAREMDIITVVDGAHAPAFINLNLEAIGADFYTGNCHKWLCAPRGSAFLYVRPEHHHLVESNVISWGYSKDDDVYSEHVAYTGSSLIERRLQWLGTRDISAFLTVPFAIQFQRDYHWESLRRECRALAIDTMHKICELVNLQPVSINDNLGQMVAIPIPSIDPEVLKDYLFSRYKIEIPVTAYKDQLFLRLSVQAYNSESELELLVKAVKEIYSL